MQIDRQRAKLDLNLGSIVKMTRMPEAVFIVDTNKESIALAESSKLGILSFAMNDTNTNPSQVNFPIPANDDSIRTIQLIMKVIADQIMESSGKIPKTPVVVEDSKVEDSKVEDSKVEDSKVEDSK